MIRGTYIRLLQRPTCTFSTTVQADRRFDFKQFGKLTKFTLSIANAGIVGFCYAYYAHQVDALSLLDLSALSASSLLMVTHQPYPIGHVDSSLQPDPRVAPR
jgi:hypothetical protein